MRDTVYGLSEWVGEVLMVLGAGIGVGFAGDANLQSITL